jgi:hypothetical protein
LVAAPPDGLGQLQASSIREVFFPELNDLDTAR